MVFFSRSAFLGYCLSVLIYALQPAGFTQSVQGGENEAVPERITKPPRVTVESGELEGQSQNGLNVFKGIPYATPPVGNLRWRAPQPVKPWTGVHKAQAFGNDAPQAAMISLNQDEDCLYLIDQLRRP